MKIKNLLTIIVLFTFLYSGVQKSYAIFGIGDISFDPTLNAQQIRQFVQDSASYGKEVIQTSLMSSLQIKEFSLDTVANLFAKKALKAMEKSTLTWVKGGFEGKPSFLQNPQSFFSNIAVVELSNVTRQLATDLRYANRDVAAALIQGTRNNLKYEITPTVDLTVRNNICNEYKTEFLVKQQGRAASSQDDNIYEKQAAQKAWIDDVCSGPITEEKYQALKKCFKNDAYCGGWNTWNALTQDPRNDSNYRLQKAREALFANTAKQELSKKEDLQRGNGFFSLETCPDEKKVGPEKAYKVYIPASTDENGNEIKEVKEGCINPEYVTPGKAAADVVSGIVTSPTRQGELADEINETLTNVVQGFIDGVLNKGFIAVADSINDAANNVDNTLANLNNSLSDAVSNYNSLPPAPTGSTQLQPGDLTNAERSRIVAPMLSTMKNTLAEHKKGYKAIQEEYNFYQNLAGYIGQIPQCYNTKISQEQQFIANGEKPAPAKITVPGDVQNYINTRVTQAQNRLTGIQAETVNYKKDEQALIDAISILEKTKSGEQIQAIYEAYMKDVTSQRYLNEATSNIRSTNNRADFETLSYEAFGATQQYGQEPNVDSEPQFAKGFGKKALEDCQDIDPRVYGTRFDF